MIPAMYDLPQGRVSITELREARVEDLLERETVSLEENDLVGFLGGKVVMVTGAGGSIGSELARQVARERMQSVFREHRPQVVAHAAAHKHVPLMETNATEAMGRGGEIFVLDMGEPVHILDLAKRMIEMSGYRRSGEKLFEELQYSGESIDKTRHPKIFIGKIAGVPASELAAALGRLGELASAGSADDIRAYLGAFLPEAQLNGGQNGAAPPAAGGSLGT
jgi:FlaA1/EpsC-like NDP-sugar epimerase